ncbi:MAG: FmdB family zinc ribbon protein [Thermoanaerobaculaceae bacterium]
MPIFEYLCTACNRIYSFLSFSTSPKREPTCPRCGNASLKRVPSAFSVASKRTSGSSAKAEKDQERIPQTLESEVEKLLANVDEKDMEDPRTMARVMRRLAEASGEPVPDTLQEMMQRLEAGEDPEKLEEELGDQLEEELGDEDREAERFDSAAPERDSGLYSL